MTLDNLSFTLSSPLVERWTVSQESSHRWGRRWFWWLIWYEHSFYKNASYLHPQSSAGGAPLLTSLQATAIFKNSFPTPPTPIPRWLSGLRIHLQCRRHRQCGFHLYGSGRSSAGGNGNPLQYSCLENPMDRGAWEATVLGVTKSRTQLSD